MPALEKYELVERLVRALELGKFLEEYDDSRDALVRFARRLTHHLDAIGERWLHVARIKPLCALRAAGLVARGQLQQMNDSATSQLDGMRASRDDHVETHRQQEVRYGPVCWVWCTQKFSGSLASHTPIRSTGACGRVLAARAVGIEDKSDHIACVAMESVA